MHIVSEKLPDGNFWARPDAVVRSSAELGQLLRTRRNLLQLKQADLAGIANTGNRFIVDVESGKPTVQLQKVLDLMDLLGLELVVRPKAAALP